MNADDHLRMAERLIESADNDTDVFVSIMRSTSATAHAAIASALYARDSHRRAVPSVTSIRDFSD